MNTEEWASGLVLKTWRNAEGDQLREEYSGIWSMEPDKAQWIDQKTNLDCLAVRGPLGAWCGYVGLPPGHPGYGKDYQEVEALYDIDIHGGLTFSDACQKRDDPSVGICHVPQEGRDKDIWWIGFDCAHAWDLVPVMQKYGTYGTGDVVYRDLRWVIRETARLAEQVTQKQV